RLKNELVAARAEHLSQIAATSQQAWSERERLSEEMARRSAELQEGHLELEGTRAALREYSAESERLRQQRASLETELADVREEVSEARAVLAGRATVSRELVEQELRQHQYRVIAYISGSIRSALTNVLGFSKLLLRPEEG